MKNPFALIVLACQTALMEGHIMEELHLVTFIDNKDINSKFDQIIYTLTGGTINMGIIETIKMQERRDGIEIGIEKGIQKGEAIGRHAEALEIAREMKKDKFPIEKIAKLTKLTLKEIEAL